MSTTNTCMYHCEEKRSLHLPQRDLFTAVSYGFLFLCDFLFILACHIGFKAIGYRVRNLQLRIICKYGTSEYIKQEQMEV